MTREETTFSSDELGEIFGGLTAVKKEEPKKTNMEPGAVKTLVVHDKFAELERPVKAAKPAEPLETDVDELVRRAEEIQREDKIPPSAPDAKGVEPARVLELFEEIRKFFAGVLEQKIDKKTLENMMLRTLEKTAACNSLLKNTNWDAEGNLRLNGAIDAARMMKNIGLCADKNASDQAIAAALSALLYLRLNSVKQGLGQEMYRSLREKLCEKSLAIEAGYGAATAHFFKNNIFDPAIIKGDGIK